MDRFRGYGCVTYPGQVFLDESAHGFLAETVSALFTYENIPDHGTVDSQIQKSAQIIPVRELFRELQGQRANPQADQRIGKFSLKVRKSIREKCCHLTLCQIIAAKSKHLNRKLFWRIL